MKVILNYFMPSGEWYYKDQYETDMKELSQIWDEVKNKNRHRYSKDKWYIISVDVPDHPNNHPHLII